MYLSTSPSILCGASANYRDVAIVFHSHCLSPWRFYTDMNRRGPSLWSKKVAFPLERLASLIESSVWTDIESEKIWNDKYPRSTYQIWDSDPVLGMSKLILQDIQFSCPWCDTQQTIPLGTWTEIHTTKTAVWSCASCQVKFNADTLSAKYLKDDLLEFNKTNNPWYHPYFLRRLTCRTVKGVIPGRFDVNPEETGNADLGFILETVLHPGDRTQHLPPTRMHLYIFINTTIQPTWKDIDYSFDQTMAQLKGARLLRMLSRGNIFISMRIAYQGILYKHFSIDLVAAALRQREFAMKITAPELAPFDSPSALDVATTRYHKFLLLMNRKSGNSGKNKKFSLVPTLDIDLCWHTHQLFFVEYRDWCISHLGTAVNHDDTVAKEDLDSGLKETTNAWTNAYRESYNGGTSKPKKFGLFSRRNVEGKGKGVGDEGEEYLKMYPYWLKVPEEWKFPAACANSGKNGRGGWAASVDRQREATTMAGAKCAGCTAACTYEWGD